MGNALINCMLQPSGTVRVMRSDGEIVEFDHPVIAKQLMKAYPGHLVVHCSSISRTKIGQRSKVSMMRAEDVLIIGHTYCLLQVPNQGGKVLLPKRPTFKPPSAEISNTRRLTLRSFLGDNDLFLSDDTLEERVFHQLHQTGQQQHAPKGPWRPQLDAIMESPSRPLHSSITMSPVARHAGYIPASSAIARRHTMNS